MNKVSFWPTARAPTIVQPNDGVANHKVLFLKDDGQSAYTRRHPAAERGRLIDDPDNDRQEEVGVAFYSVETGSIDFTADDHVAKLDPETLN